MADARILGVRLDLRALPELKQAAEGAIAARDRSFIFACANPHSLVIARKDARFRAALDAASAVVADGVGCRWGAALSGIAVGQRITGFDFFSAVMNTLNQRCGRAFFFGSTETTLRLIRQRVARDFPKVAVGTLSPPFGQWSDEDNERMREEIRAFRPDILWVGMTAPKQEKWVADNTAALPIPVIASIGAVFDYYAGVVYRAPPWVCKLGLEWLYRLPREPKRLWKRTFISAPAFLWFSLLERRSLKTRS
jgi:N-acetylglucosaminyldiphosphoundecaprenol N-acetyl-beta-D-mannosaminyltransferase